MKIERDIRLSELNLIKLCARHYQTIKNDLTKMRIFFWIFKYFKSFCSIENIDYLTI